MKGTIMGWWEGNNGTDLLGDGPADTLSAALKDAAEIYGRKPTLEEFLNSLQQALAIDPSSLLLDGHNVSTLTARLKNGESISTGDPELSDDRVVKVLYQALEDIATEYEEMEDQRKPRLSEVLATASFILRPDTQKFVDTPSGGGVESIVPTALQHLEGEPE